MQADSTGQSLRSYIADRNVDGVRELLRMGANPNTVDADGCEALWIASAIGDEAIVRLLLSAGAKPDALGLGGSTALMQAVSRSNLDIAIALIQAGADVNTRDEHGASALILSAERRDLEVVRVLLKSGADPNAQAHDGRTPLEAGSWRTMETLVVGSKYYRHGVRVAAEDPVLQLLLAAGAR